MELSIDVIFISFAVFLIPSIIIALVVDVLANRLEKKWIRYVVPVLAIGAGIFSFVTGYLIEAEHLPGAINLDWMDKMLCYEIACVSLLIAVSTYIFLIVKDIVKKKKKKDKKKK